MNSQWEIMVMGQAQLLLKVNSKIKLDSGYQKSDYNYEALTKNHMPSSQKDAGYNYGSYNNEYS